MLTEPKRNLAEAAAGLGRPLAVRWVELLQARAGYDNPATSAEPRDTQLRGRLLQTQGWVETCPA